MRRSWLLAVCQPEPCFAARAHSRLASSLQVQSRPVPPHDPLSGRCEKMTPIAMAAMAIPKIKAVARKVCIGNSESRMRVIAMWQGYREIDIHAQRRPTTLISSIARAIREGYARLTRTRTAIAIEGRPCYAGLHVRSPGDRRPGRTTAPFLPSRYE